MVFSTFPALAPEFSVRLTFLTISIDRGHVRASLGSGLEVLGRFPERGGAAKVGKIRVFSPLFWVFPI